MTASIAGEIAGERQPLIRGVSREELYLALHAADMATVAVVLELVNVVGAVRRVPPAVFGTPN